MIQRLKNNLLQYYDVKEKEDSTADKPEYTEIIDVNSSDDDGGRFF